jgi:Beta-lactamase superfamily domain
MSFSLSDSIELHLEYEDTTKFGTTVSGRLEAELKQRFRPAIELLMGGHPGAVRETAAVLEALGLDGSAEFLSGPSAVRPELSFPAPSETFPKAVRVFRGWEAPVRVPLPRPLTRDLAAWLGDWQRNAVPPTPGPARTLWEALAELGCFATPTDPVPPRGAATFVGHATVLLTGPRTTVLIDPFLLPRDEQFPVGYQPLTHGSVAPDAVIVTHSHHDHFHVDSLLRLDRNTPIFVPDVPRESSLAVDMVYRLNEIGFADVRTLSWHQQATIGDFTVISLPMYGEQPTSDAPLPPDVRNFGNSYVIKGGGRSFAFVADAGCDHLGDVRSLATQAFER